jgi:galactose mutarotase-like enzyme
MDQNSVIKKISPQNGQSFFTVSPKGAAITLTLNNIPILVEVKRFDGKVRSTHPCSPNFANKENAFGLPQHGPVRDEMWKVTSETDDSITLTCPIEDGTYPKGLKITQSLRITENRFEIYTVHSYTGTVPAPLIFGEHCYWDAPLGIEGMKLNNEDIHGYKDFQKKFHNDGVVVPLDIQNKVDIPGKPSIELEQENMPYAVTWQGEGDSAYVCLEPVTMNPQKDTTGKPYFGTEASLIQPGKVKTAYLSIKI